MREDIKGAAFERSDCGKSFQSALGNEGLILARGDRRDFVAIDHAGGMHALGKRILGASAPEIRIRLSDLLPGQLPSVEEARRLIRKGELLRASTSQLPEPSPVGKRREEGPIELRSVGAGAEVSHTALPETQLLSHAAALPPAPAVQACSVEPTKPIRAIGNEAKSHGLAASMKRQFRAAVSALFKRTPSPQPQGRRRRTGETEGTFRMTARYLLRPIIRLPAFSRAVGFLSDTLPWLHLWEWNEVPDQDFATNTASDTGNHLSPHP